MIMLRLLLLSILIFPFSASAAVAVVETAWGGSSAALCAEYTCLTYEDITGQAVSAIPPTHNKYLVRATVYADETAYNAPVKYTDNLSGYPFPLGYPAIEIAGDNYLITHSEQFSSSDADLYYELVAR